MSDSDRPKRVVRGLDGELDIDSRTGQTPIEELPRAISRLGLRRWFNRIENHGGPLARMPANAMLVFYDAGFDVNVVEPDIHLTSNVLRGVRGEERFVFYECHRLPYPDEYGFLARKIYVNHKFAGLFFPRAKSLLLSDWTHFPSGVDALEEVWPALLEATGLEMLPGDENHAPVKEKKKKKQKIEVTLGCDPEFELVTSRGVRSASGVFYTDRRIGLDGAGSQVELRPEPSRKPHEVVADLKTLFNEFNTRCEQGVLSVLGNTFPLGGHIHVGVGGAYAPPVGLINMLDDFLGRPFQSLAGGARGSYQSLSAFERKNWGFEYRTPPAGLFLKPDITRIVLKITKNVVESFINKREVVYDVPPVLEDYRRIGGITEKEYGRLFSFAREYNSLDKTASAFWTNRTAPTRTTGAGIGFNLRDDWNPAIQTNLRSLLSTALRRARINPRIRFVELYGLSSQRGEVTTVPFGDFETVPPRERPYAEVDGDHIWIGLPYSVRNDTSVYADHVDELVRAIKTRLKEVVI